MKYLQLKKSYWKARGRHFEAHVTGGFLDNDIDIIPQIYIKNLKEQMV